MVNMDAVDSDLCAMLASMSVDVAAIDQHDSGCKRTVKTRHSSRLVDEPSRRGFFAAHYGETVC